MPTKIFIDQGHNPTGHNTGAEGFGLREQDVNYAVGMYLADLLKADPRFEVRTSRTTPEQILGTSNATSLAERVRGANNWPADYFISIHSNANPNPAVNGSEVYIYKTGSQAELLAQKVLDAVVQRVGTKNNLVRVNPSLYVLRRTKMPSILVELGYLTNESDAEKLKNDQQGFAQGIYEGILNYFGMSKP